jgi:tape measure domain-containing protein
MAVNDLMMRIQLLTDTGKSTAELNKLSNQLKSLTSQLQSLQRNSLSNLTKDIESLKSAQSSLKATNIQTFAKTLDEAKKSFASLNLNTSNIDKLRQGYLSLQQQISKTALATQQHSDETKKLNDRLKEAKQYSLTSTGTLRNNTLLNAQVDIARYTDAIKLADTAARTHRQTILDLKKELVEASRIKFNSTDTIDLQKLKTWANASGRGITVSKDTKSFDSLVAFNNELKKQQDSLDKTKDKAKSYQETLAKLRLESQRAAIPDLLPNGRNLLGDLDSVRSKIATLNTQGILPLTNSIRTLQAQSNLDRAFKVDPLKAKIAVARAEVQKWASELQTAKITGNDVKYNALTSQIEKNQQKIVDLTLEAAKNNLKIVEGTSRQAALELKSLSNKKNELAVYKDQETAIKSIVAAQKQLAQQNIQSVKTKTGGIFDTTSKQNVNNAEANVYKANIAALKQYYAERKAAAQSDSESIKARIRDTQQQLAQGQLTKSQYAAERAALKEVVAEQKRLSAEYQQTLRTQKESLNLSLSAEKANTTAIRNQLKDLVLLNTEAARAKSIDLTSKLQSSKSNQSSLVQQIRETNALAEAETKRIAVLERLAGASQKQSTGLAIQATETLIKEVTKRLDELNAKSEQAKAKLNAIGGGNTNLTSVKQQIKDVQQQLADLRSVGNLAPSQAINFSNLRDNLKNLREQQKLLTQISQVDVKTSTGKIELGNLNGELAKLRELRSEMSKIQQFGRGFASGFGFSLTPEQLGFSAFNLVIGVLDNLKQKFIEANSQSEILIRGLSAVFGAGQGTVQFDKLTATANKFGLAIHDLSRNYLSLNASAKGTILEGKESEKIFNSLASAMAVLGADTITTQRAFRAVSQMISKGQVYAEELKGQLAEALPGAVNTFAQSMGKTTQEFLGMVKAGKVGLNELIPFFEQVQAQYGSAATASVTYEQATNRLSNAYTILLKGLGDTGVWSVLVGLIETVSSKIQNIANAIPEIDSNFKLFLNSLQSTANKTIILIKYKLGIDTSGNQISDIFNSIGSNLESINGLFSIEGRIKSFSQALVLVGRDIDSLFSSASEGSKKLQTALSQSDWKIKVQSIDPTAFDGLSEAKINELYNFYVLSTKRANQEIVVSEAETNAKIDILRSENLRKTNRDIEIQMKSYQKMQADEMQLWKRVVLSIIVRSIQRILH